MSSNIESIPVDIAIFTGVAGAVDPKLRQWDVILADSLIQHDMDARPLFDKYVIPSLNNKRIIPNIDLLDKIHNGLKKLNQKDFMNLVILQRVNATGDLFVSDTKN